MGVVEAALQRYGSLGPGEEKRVPVVKENLADVLASAFAVWRGFFPNGISYDSIETAYQEAVKLVSPYACLFSGMSAEEFDGISRRAILPLIRTSSQLQWKPYSLSGLFLSAVLNHTGLEAMAGIFDKIEYLGYRLEEGKLLEVQSGSDVVCSGLYSHGIILNYSDTYMMAENALGGTQINCGRVTLFCLGSENTTSITFRTGHSLNAGIRRLRMSGLELIMNLDEAPDIAFHYSELFGRASFNEIEPFSSLSRQALEIARQLSWLPASDGVDLSVHPPAYWRGIDVQLRGILKEMDDAVAGYKGK
ncbi:TPA: hypothetical protein HA231_01805 [Candidatus Woesearchaeota archaeon]|nr:hypothetical protein [Candidatus Woesearchaeota archaeon]